MRKHPDWLKVRIPSGEAYNKVNKILESNNIHTVCREAKCPNIAECWGNGTATFLILGDICTRNCSYCNVSHGSPKSIMSTEPIAVADSVKKLKLRYVVITSVTRDDLLDGGASVFVDTIQEIRKMSDCKIEVLTPDFKGIIHSLKLVVNSCPDVFSHNMEVVKSLFRNVRPEGNYERSIEILRLVKSLNKTIKTKSGIMVGLGESKEEIISLMKDLRKVECDIFTIGQYLQPTKKHHEVVRYYSPEEFKELEDIAYSFGFKHVYSGPLIRSSYHAEKVFR